MLIVHFVGDRYYHLIYVLVDIFVKYSDRGNQFSSKKQKSEMATPDFMHRRAFI